MHASVNTNLDLTKSSKSIPLDSGMFLNCSSRPVENTVLSMPLDLNVWKSRHKYTLDIFITLRPFCSDEVLQD